MEIHTTARHFELTPGLRAHVEERLERVHRFVTRTGEIRVILEVEKYRHAAEVTVKVDGHDLVARAHSDNMYTSVDQAVEKILEQVKRLRDTARSRRRRKPGVDETEPAPEES